MKQCSPFLSDTQMLNTHNSLASEHLVDLKEIDILQR
jgi:hypothetical protein